MAKKDELIETIEETKATEEEVIQAVAEAITEEAKESNESVEKVVEKIVDEGKPNKKLDEKVQKRGFKNYKHASEWMKSESFKKLHQADQKEISDWFKNLK